MKVLVYGRTLQIGGTDVRQQLQTIISEQDMEVCTDLEALCSCLRKAGNHYTLAVLICPAKDDLLQLNSLAHLFSDLRVVLFVPNFDETTVAVGHRLFPRYLESIDAGPGEVMEVLRNLLNGQARIGHECLSGPAA